MQCDECEEEEPQPARPRKGKHARADGLSVAIDVALTNELATGERPLHILLSGHSDSVPIAAASLDDPGSNFLVLLAPIKQPENAAETPQGALAAMELARAEIARKGVTTNVSIVPFKCPTPARLIALLRGLARRGAAPTVASFSLIFPEDGFRHLLCPELLDALGGPLRRPP